MFQSQFIGDLSYGEHPRQQLDICAPQQTDVPPPLILCFHSGWFQAGQAQQLRHLMLQFAAIGYASASIGYRLHSDAVQLNDIIDDCKKGITYACEEAQILGAAQEKPCLLGSGVGGLLALNCALQEPGRYAGVISCGTTPQLQEWDDCKPGITQAIKNVTSQDESLRDSCSPLQQDCSKLPPLLMLHGDHDPEVPVKVARELHVRCIDQGVSSSFAVLSGAQHRFLEDNGSRAAQSALKHIQDWLKQRYFDEQSEVPVGEPGFIRQ